MERRRVDFSVVNSPCLSGLSGALDSVSSAASRPGEGNQGGEEAVLGKMGRKSEQNGK